jgi:hypothetical protein
MHVEHFARQGAGWLLIEMSAPNAILRLPALDAALPLAVIYATIEFPPPNEVLSAEC